MMARRARTRRSSASRPRLPAGDGERRHLHGLLLGDDGLLDERQRVKLYTQAAADPPSENARLSLPRIPEARVKAAGSLGKYTDRIAEGQWREADLLVEVTMLPLKIARSIVYEPASTGGGDADGDGHSPPADGYGDGPPADCTTRVRSVRASP